MIPSSPPTYDKNLLPGIALTVSIGPAGVLETDGKAVHPVTGTPRLVFFYSQVIRQLWKYLNRHSQRKSYNCGGFRRLLAQFGVVKPHIVNRLRPDGFKKPLFPAWLDAFADVSTSEKPGAVVPHAGICAVAAGQLAVLPRWRQVTQRRHL